jgi:uncharacterized protein (DUF1499 family)
LQVHEEEEIAVENRSYSIAAGNSNLTPSQRRFGEHVMTEQAADSMPASGQSWWSRAILVGAVVAATMLPLGALGTRLGIWDFRLGLLLVAGGTLLAAIGVIVGIAGIIAARRRNLGADKPAVYIGTLVSALIIAVMGTQFAAATSVPPIHNISTDVADPPAFDRIVTLRGEGANPLEYKADELAAAQQQAYPWVKTYNSALPPAAALERAAAVLDDMGLEVVHLDEQAGIVEATATTFWFGFKDDVVVRVRPAPDGSGTLVDMRSVSRVGVSDLGANARRIGEFLDRFAKT